MPSLIVVSNPAKWSIPIPGVRITSAKEYLTSPEIAAEKGLKVFNLCRSYKYQSEGYYVSLLAMARHHSIMPGIATFQEMKSASYIKSVNEDLDALIQKQLKPVNTKEFTLSIYFGKNMEPRFEKLSTQLASLFRAPLIRAQFIKQKKWILQTITPVSMSEIPDDHRPFLEKFASTFFQESSFRKTNLKKYPWTMGILHNPSDPEPPSTPQAMKKFIKAAESRGFRVQLITKDDFNLLPRFDALFIRETTNVNHYTYRFASRAESEGLAVIDDPMSIIRCTNKVYLAELLSRNSIPSPATSILHKGNLEQKISEARLPVVLKKPDSAFSFGVKKAGTPEELKKTAAAMLEDSEMIIMQDFLPTDFDWRVGIIDNKILYVCKYFMAENHWQVINPVNKGKGRYGRSVPVRIEETPSSVLKTALKTARLIGNGLYGVDIKMIGTRPVVIEINDNPSIDHGSEDFFLKNRLYEQIMDVFLRRVEELKK